MLTSTWLSCHLNALVGHVGLCNVKFLNNLLFLFDAISSFTIAPICAWGMKAAFKFIKHFAWVFSLSVLPSLEKDSQISIHLGPRRYMIVWYWSVLGTFWSYSKNYIRTLNSWKAGRWPVAFQSIVGRGKDSLYAIVRASFLWKGLKNQTSDSYGITNVPTDVWATDIQ